MASEWSGDIQRNALLLRHLLGFFNSSRCQSINLVNIVIGLIRPTMRWANIGPPSRLQRVGLVETALWAVTCIVA